MKNTHCCGTVLIGLSCLAILGQPSFGQEATSQPDSPPTSQPDAMATELGTEHFESRFEYLLSRYDANGDGQISMDEYERENGQFERLDKDEDGMLTESDFAGGRGGMRVQMKSMAAQRHFAAHFQADDDHTIMTPDELATSIAAYDTNGNGMISTAEYEAKAESRWVELPGDDIPMLTRMMGNYDAWETMAEPIDANGDGEFGGSEMMAFFTTHAEEGQWEITNPMERRRGRGGRNRGQRGDDSEGEAQREPQDGAMVGEMAPDFTLQPPNGGETVVLSSHRDNLPVALIFGSYT
ncbi:MAG: hypothetical protein O7G85_09360 [Planctomycetota bacterium]|nr:hypothetical protein [Planctomycetota bacterium]